MFVFVSYVMNIVKLAFNLCFECRENKTFSEWKFRPEVYLGLHLYKAFAEKVHYTYLSVRMSPKCVP